MSYATPGIALITGASSGIGRSCAIALAQAGWTCIISGRRLEQLHETNRLGSEVNPDKPMYCVAGDLSKEEDVDRLFDHIKTEFGRIDLLFNNAGVSGPRKEFDEVTASEFSEVVAINITASYLCAQRAFKLMKTQSPMGGRIINNGSISAHSPRPLSAPYSLTKSAITGLTKSIALDGRPYNIACGQLDVGNAESAMGSRMKAGVPQASGLIAAEPVMNVEYVSRTLVFMASLPLEANMLNSTVMATNMPFVGRG